MDNYRDFQGNDIDECIAKATEYFGLARENLEIEIVQDAKSGIFGIVGARKAKIRARRARVHDTMVNLFEQERPLAPGSLQENEEKKADSRDLPWPPAESETKESALLPSGDEKDEGVAGTDASTWPDIPWEELDHDKMRHKLDEIVQTLVGGIAGKEVSIRINLSRGKPAATIEWKGDAGLLIGREGQTLVALQYLASRMLSHAMGSTLRVQLDIGHYRLRQDDNLREMAKSLAKKVRLSGKPLSTRPLSSYHRRVIHVCLQPDPDVQTKSIGDGPLKRVLITPKRACPPL